MGKYLVLIDYLYNTTKTSKLLKGERKIIVIY